MFEFLLYSRFDFLLLSQTRPHYFAEITHMNKMFLSLQCICNQSRMAIHWRTTSCLLTVNRVPVAVAVITDARSVTRAELKTTLVKPKLPSPDVARRSM